jgi:hypothetical protein
MLEEAYHRRSVYPARGHGALHAVGPGGEICHQFLAFTEMLVFYSPEKNEERDIYRGVIFNVM